MARTMRRQQGAATVESAIILIIFLVLIMGIIEFALLIFNASSLVEATRAGARHLIVNEPLVTLSDETCATPAVADCADGDCDGVLGLMQKFYPRLGDVNLEVEYRCSTTGSPDAYEDIKIYEVEVRLKEVEYTFITPGILGLDATITLPDFKTTRLSEDLETP
ncbi:MAG: pilus assembly protein [Gammaproteobacteria bacterium]|nr:pilus assembly protein [Gammaproteobacteria bacterium]MCW8957739.1 pilus assembly protein [Gammaproteobacteria bacterium]MCW8972841.1 pilus assembly protein [Gammaproteobacteria bacterium]MCW8992086.1 pilus assembly protein [Gammaproteobacteria bacterium]